MKDSRFILLSIFKLILHPVQVLNYYLKDAYYLTLKDQQFEGIDMENLVTDFNRRILETDGYLKILLNKITAIKSTIGKQ